MTDTPRYTVGDTVILTDVNYKGSKTATVTKVGRTLVYVDRDMYGRPDSAYRIETGARNDNYQHGRIWTTAEYEERTKRSDLLGALRDEGVTFDRVSRIPTERLEKILEVFK